MEVDGAALEREPPWVRKPFVRFPLRNRSDILRQILVDQKAEAFVVTFLPDIRWATGFSGSNALLVVRPEGLHFITDGRYAGQVQKEVTGATVHVPGYALMDYVVQRGLLDGADRVLFQAEHLTLSAWQRWQEVLHGLKLVPLENLLTRHVAQKTAEEIDVMRRAQAITERVFEEVVGELRPGRTEREIAAEIVYRHLGQGADRMAFEPIVASGPQSALPHARPTDRVMQQGEMIVLDFGCVVEGYACDMTRTVALGEPEPEARRVYEVVRKAQAAALIEASAGMTTKALDHVARSSIQEAGYGDRFSHGLGHGIGLQTHEWPRVSYHTDDVLPAGAVVTIEPGIYLPGRFGVRIEDMVVLKDGGSENLTHAAKDLLIL